MGALKANPRLNTFPPARVFTVKAGVKTDGNAPSLFVPPGRVGGHVPQVRVIHPLHDLIAMGVHQFQNCGRGFKRHGFGCKAEGFNQLANERGPSVHRGRRDACRAAHNGPVFGVWLAHKRAR
jgi:hypothetical protein